jgi:chromosome segregation ATPase
VEEQRRHGVRGEYELDEEVRKLRADVTQALGQLVLIEEFLVQHIHKDIKKIMGTQQEAVQALTDVKTSLDDIGTEIDHIGTETDGLVKAVADLTAAAGNMQTTPEFDAALSAVTASKDALKTRVKTVDDKVADATTTVADATT